MRPHRPFDPFPEGCRNVNTSVILVTLTLRVRLSGVSGLLSKIKPTIMDEHAGAGICVTEVTGGRGATRSEPYRMHQH